MIHPNAILKVDRKLVSSFDKNFIRMDDEILGGFKGFIPIPGPRDKSAMHSVLVITNKRVIFWDRRIMKAECIESYHYPNIRSAYQIQGPFSSYIIIDVLGRNKRFEGMTTNDAKAASDLINTRLNRFIQSQNRRSLANQEDPMMILDRRLAAGQISIIEYQRAKNAIMGEITKPGGQECPSCGSIDSIPEKYCMECGFHLK